MVAGAFVLALSVGVAGCATSEFTTGQRTSGAESAPGVASPGATPLDPTPTPTATPPPVLVSASAAASADARFAVATGGYVLGDSISLAVAPILSRLGFPVVGRVGQSATDAYLSDNLSTPAAQAAPAWVIVLGTNNRGDAADIAAIPHWLDLIDSLRPKGLPVYWVTPYRSPLYTGGLSTVTLDAFNTALNQQAADHRWLGIIDFATPASLHPEWFLADAQHLHPDAAGQGVLAALIAGADAVPLGTPAPVISFGPAAPATAANQPTGEPTTFTNVPIPTKSTPPAPPPTEPAPTPVASQPAAPVPSTGGLPAPQPPVASGAPAG